MNRQIQRILSDFELVLAGGDLHAALGVALLKHLAQGLLAAQGRRGWRRKHRNRSRHCSHAGSRRQLRRQRRRDHSGLAEPGRHECRIAIEHQVVRLVVGIVGHALVDLFLGATPDLIHADGARVVQVPGVAQHAVSHVLGGKAAFKFVIKADLVVTRGADVDDVLRQGSLGAGLQVQAAGLDVHRATALFGDAGKLGPQQPFVIGVAKASRAHGRRRLHHPARMAGVVHHKQLVSFLGDGLEQIGHLAVGDGAALAPVIGQQGLHAAPHGRVVEAGAVARVVDEDPIALLHLVGQLLQRLPDAVAAGLFILQIADIAERDLHRLRHLGGRLAVDAGTGKGGRGRIGIATDADDQRVAIDARWQAAHPQCQGDIAARLAPAGQRGRP